MVYFTVIDKKAALQTDDTGSHSPEWLPEAVRHYLAHTEAGVSIRQLAREADCHASTILRQIRRFETLRDDPLVDGALSRFGRRGGWVARPQEDEEHLPMKPVSSEDFSGPVSDAVLRRDGLAVLRHLAMPRTVLAVASDMDKGVIVRESADGAPERVDVVARNLAEALVLKDWITSRGEGRVSRYGITQAGRTALNLLMAKSENAARGFAEGPAGFDLSGARRVGADAISEEDEPEARRVRGLQADTPIAALARRRDRDGSPFLSPEQLRAGARLAEDFELSQMGPRTTQDWSGFLTAGVSSGFGSRDGVGGGSAARERVAEALRELGPGLGDIVLLCACRQEGLETAERRLGWSARSAKIVLRIALDRLARHYAGQPAERGLIG